jgi:hypothetical protein
MSRNWVVSLFISYLLWNQKLRNNPTENVYINLHRYTIKLILDRYDILLMVKVN